MTRRVSFAELESLARRGAGRLSSLDIGRSDRLLVCLPTSWEWMEYWLGALLLGAWPVAVAPASGLGSSETHVMRLEELASRFDARRVVAAESLRREADRLAAADLGERLVTPEELASQRPISWSEQRPDPDETAFLQLTSGTTGRSRGVMISHRSVLHNNRASSLMIRDLPADPTSSSSSPGAPAEEWSENIVSWLPLHHDMGLVGCLFMSITCGLDLWLLPPTSFLARPHLWLEHLAGHGRALAPAPNFGFQLCVERLEDSQIESLDLSDWRAALVGAEMVRPETMTAFTGLTRATGFDPRAFRACYGLAEGTLAVTFDVRGEGPRTRPHPEGNGEVVSVGGPLADTELKITAPDGRAMRDGEIGEVWVKGPGVFQGYFADPDATAEGLRSGWLATGDLGFLADGELYLTGRLKDILILRGHNLMPHELEWLAEGVTGGGGAERAGAFSIDGGPEGEVPVLVVETGERDPEALAHLDRQIRLRVGHELSMTLADLAFVRRGRIPKSSSGKVKRLELRSRYLAGELERL